MVRVTNIVQAPNQELLCAWQAQGHVPDVVVLHVVAALQVLAHVPGGGRGRRRRGGWGRCSTMVPKGLSVDDGGSLRAVTGAEEKKLLKRRRLSPM
jgi:hypothetical protein